MENLYSSKGAILISALLFLLVITIMVIAALDIGLLQTKMSGNFRDKVFSQQKAEQNLFKDERLISKSKKLPVNIKKISTEICGVTFYRVTAEGEYHGAKTILQSAYAILGDTSSCHPKPFIHTGRKSWRICSS